MKTKMFLVPLLMIVASCSLTQNRREISAGHTGCRPDEIYIQDEQDLSWVAVCHEKRYVCSADADCTLEVGEEEAADD